MSEKITAKTGSAKVKKAEPTRESIAAERAVEDLQAFLAGNRRGEAVRKVAFNLLHAYTYAEADSIAAEAVRMEAEEGADLSDALSNECDRAMTYTADAYAYLVGLEGSHEDAWADVGAAGVGLAHGKEPSDVVSAVAFHGLRQAAGETAERIKKERVGPGTGTAGA